MSVTVVVETSRAPARPAVGPCLDCGELVQRSLRAAHGCAEQIGNDAENDKALAEGIALGVVRTSDEEARRFGADVALVQRAHLLVAQGHARDPRLAFFFQRAARAAWRVAGRWTVPLPRSLAVAVAVVTAADDQLRAQAHAALAVTRSEVSAPAREALGHVEPLAGARTTGAPQSAVDPRPPAA
jgi:hypothetical protein